MDKELATPTTDISTSGSTEPGGQWDSLATYEKIRTAPDIGDEKTVEEVAFSMGIDDLGAYDLSEVNAMVAAGAPWEEVRAYVEELLNEQRGYSVNRESLGKFRRIKYAAETGRTVPVDRADSSSTEGARVEESLDEAGGTSEREGGSPTVLYDTIKRNAGEIAKRLGYTDSADTKQMTNLIFQRVIGDPEFWAMVAVHEGLGAEEPQVAALKRWLEQEGAKLPPHDADVSPDSTDQPVKAPESPEAPKPSESSYSTDSSETQTALSTKAPEVAEPEPNVVDDARTEVAEALGETGETGGAEKPLLDRVVIAAKGRTRIGHSVPRGIKVTHGSVEGYSLLGGHQTFGDDPELNEGKYVRIEGVKHNAPEALVFSEIKEMKYGTEIVEVENRVTTGRWIFKKTEIIKGTDECRVEIGEAPVMVRNPETDEQEPGVRVAYRFDSSGGDYQGPKWLDSSGRAGNYLAVETILPKSIADRLRTGATDNPQLARKFAEMLTLANGVSQDDWDNGMRPPYNGLPDDWKIAVL